MGTWQWIAQFNSAWVKNIFLCFKVKQLNLMGALQTLNLENYHQFPFSMSFRVLCTFVFHPFGCLSNCWAPSLPSPCKEAVPHLWASLLPFSDCLWETKNKQTKLQLMSKLQHSASSISIGNRSSKQTWKKCSEIFPTSTDRWNWHCSNLSGFYLCWVAGISEIIRKASQSNFTCVKISTCCLSGEAQH